MSTLESNKILAAIGAVLFGIGIFATGSTVFGIVVPIIGLILLLMGVKGLAENYSEPSIYSNTLKVVIYSIIAIIIFGVGIVGSIAILFGFGVSLFAVVGVIIGIIALIVSLVLTFVFFVLSAKHFKMASDMLAQKTGNSMFNTAGKLYYWGAWLSIILVGLFLIFIAWILETIAFFSINTSNQSGPSSTSNPPPPPPPSGTATRFCSNCGAPIADPNVKFCPNCGKSV